MSRAHAFFLLPQTINERQYRVFLPTAAIMNTPTGRIPAPPMTARKFYTSIKKDESRDTDVGTENIRPKAVCDRRSDSGRIVAGQTATGANKPATTLYLAIDWQRGHINTRFTSRDRRFPTPQPPLRNGRAVTTSDLFWPNHRRKPALSLRVVARVQISRSEKCQNPQTGKQSAKPG